MSPAKSLEIETVHNADGTVLSAFPISEWGRGSVRVMEVFPAIAGLSYAAILTPTFLHDGKTEIVRLSVLFSHCGMSRSAANLEQIRSRYQLIEGTKHLDAAVARVLADNATSETLLIRCWQDPNVYIWRVSLRSYLAAGELLDELPHPFGEFEIAPECGSWYMRARDDDPFLFLAAPGKMIAELEAVAADNVFEVPGSMVYAI